MILTVMIFILEYDVTKTYVYRVHNPVPSNN